MKRFLSIVVLAVAAPTASSTTVATRVRSVSVSLIPQVSPCGPNSPSASSTRPVSISPATRLFSLIVCCQKRSGATSSIPPITSTLATTTVCRPSICC